MEERSMDGKTILITGGTDGIGKQAAKELARMGAQIVLVGRDRRRCQESVDEIVQYSGNSDIDYLIADLSKMNDVKALADNFRSKHDRLDILINNAGASFLNRLLTEDGFEKTFALNHLAYFLLTDLLLDMLKVNIPSRVINVSSGSHRDGKIRFNDIHLRWFYFVYKAYSQSKLANVMFTYALARRLEGSGVSANCLNPGLVRTGIFRKVKGVGPFIEKILLRKSISVEEGAETIVYLASSEEVGMENGKFFYKKKAQPTSERSYDKDAQERLWILSQEMVSRWL